jgi:hypothetical protein
MTQSFPKSERTQTLTSIVIKTMKTFSSALLLAAFSLAFLSPAARADGSNADTKHGSMQIHTHTSSASVNSEYAKYVWLTSGDDQVGSSVNHIVVSLADQRLYAYHSGQLVAWSNISSGRPGHDTPTGSFTGSEKDVNHHSSLYDNAPMPYFMRLTDGGVGLHAGQLPGYPASHGCVRLPLGMANELYQHVDSGTPVEIISTRVNATASLAISSGVPLAQN